MGNPEVSVIVPVYNCEKYLPEMMEGFQSQQFKDFELLLIDDGSQDGSPALCDRFAETDARVRVVHQENGGVSRARNRGLDEARGKTIVFVDADDRILPGYLQDLIRAAESLSTNRQRTLVLADYQPFSEKGKEKRRFPKPFTVDFTTKEGLTAEPFRRRTGAAWSRPFKPCKIPFRSLSAFAC